MGLPVFVWTSTGVYPVGANPWNSQPLGVKPAGTYYTPAVIPPAEEWNWIFGTIASDISGAYSLVDSTPAVDWYAEFTTSGFASPHQEAAAWNALTNQWMILTATTGGTPLVQVWSSYGQDQASQWTQQGSNKLTSTGWLYSAVAQDGSSSSVVWIAGTDNTATHNILNVYFQAGGSWTLAQTATAAGYFYGVEMVVFNGLNIIAAASTNAADNLIYSFNTTGFNTTYATGVTLAAGSDWLLAQNGSMVLAIPSSLSVYTTFTSSDGSTWASHSGTNSLAALLAPGNTIVGLAWTQDAFGPCWLVCVLGGSGVPFWYRSADGISWTAQAGGASTVMSVTGMAAIGSTLVCTLADVSNGGPSNSIFSVDGGVTWYRTQAWFSSNSTAVTAGYSRSRIISANGTLGFMAFNSLWVRMSSLLGVPAVKV